jgi:exopolysaccharide production protein ExoQ
MAARTRAASRPLGALISQGLVAASSLGLQLVAFSQLGAGGLGSFSLLFGILVTVNSIQSGWIGDSLTVLDRFDPGFRRALIQSQVVAVGLTFVVTTLASLPIGGIDLNTAVLFGLASTAWVIEETIRRLLIARREFWKLVVNDAAFACGSFGLVSFTIISDNQFTLETLILALFAGAVVAIGLGVAQLPRVELSRGLLGPTRMPELASFAFWRAAQIGLRPGSQAIVRFIIVAAVSVEALGQLEAARLLLAPVLTAVNGAGVYLLPTYSSQARQRQAFRPAVPIAMAVVGGAAAAYGAIALVLRSPLAGLLPGGGEAITALALLAWTAYSIGFGAGIPAGNAMVALGRSRDAFGVRCLDATVGIIGASILAIAGWVDAAPFGLAAGTFVGAVMLLRRLGDPSNAPAPPPEPTVGSPTPAPTALLETDVLRDQVEDAAWVWQPAETRRAPRPLASVPRGRAVDLTPPRLDARRRHQVAAAPSPSTVRVRQTMQQRLLWLAPLVMIVATEYKVRRRSIDDALSGSVDPLIAVELLIYGMIGAWAIWRLASSRPKFTPLIVAMWGYILTTSASALYSTFPMLGLARAVQFVIIGAVIHLLAAEGTVDTMVRLAHGWIVLVSVSIVVGIAYVAPTTGPQVGRFTWLSVHSVSAGSMLAISLCVLFGLWLQSGRRLPEGRSLPWPRHVYALLFVFQAIFLLMTRTRGSIGGAFIALGIMAWVWSGNRMKPQLLLGSIVAGAALVLAFGEPIFQFLTRGESAESIGTFNRRTEIWTLAWESFLTRPLHGLGFTSAKGVFFDETGLGGAHNAVVNVMIDTGLAGLIWWFLLLGASIVVLNRQWAHRRVSPTHSGAAGTARADHLIIMGIYVASLINSITTEGLGAGVNVSVIWWLVTIAWLTILERPDAMPAVAEDSDDPVVIATA